MNFFLNLKPAFTLKEIIMSNEQSSEKNQILDEILLARRSIRAFSEDIPSKEDVEAIIFAGQLAPCASLAVG